MLISDLHIFMTVASAGGLSAAARQLGVVPMQVSRRVFALEEELGVRLFHRTTRSVSLTAEGQALLPYAHTMIEAEESAKGELSPSPSRASGMLRVTAPTVFGESIILALLPRLLEQHPELQVCLDLSDKIVDIVGQGLDVALRVAPLADSDLVAHRIASNPRVICAAPEYLARHGHPAKMAELDEHHCILLQAVPRWPFLINEKIHHKSMSGRVSTSSVGAVRTAAIQGLGLAMLSYWDVVQQLTEGTLVEVRLQDADMEKLAVWAVIPTRRYVPTRVKVFLAILKAELAGRSDMPASMP